MKRFTTNSAQAGDLTLVPYVVKTDLFGPESEKHRIAAELGRLVVPEKRSDPNSNLIELAFVRLKSTARDPGPPLVFLAGGPGDSGIYSLRWEFLYPWFTALREVGDVIALDQRGTGLSLPNLDCLARWDMPLDRPISRAEALQISLERCRSCATYWQGQGVDLSGYTTEESADDVDALRQALGVEKVNLYGASYGSHLALATLKRHAPHINRVIAALVEGLDHTIKLPGNIQRHLETLNQLVKADDRLNRTIPDLLELVRNVLEQLEREPVTMRVMDKEIGKEVTVGLGKFDLQLVTASGIGSRKFIGKLPARYYAMSQGDFSWLAEQVVEHRRGWVGNAMSYVMDCASGVSAERYARIQQEAQTTLLGDLINFPFPEIGEAWGSPNLGSAFRASFTADVPTLLISGTLDGRTPISNAEEVLTGLPHSQHLIVEGAGHATAELASRPQIRDMMIEFLRGHALTTTSVAIPFELATLDLANA